MIADSTQSKGYSGVGGNLVLADSSGNIGYQMVASVPVRKNKTPYSGLKVLDGTSSANDWDWGSNVPLIDLPRSLNPERGYIVTSNNRQSPDHAINDYGAIAMPTPRALRITEIIEEGIQSGKKFRL